VVLEIAVAVAAAGAIVVAVVVAVAVDVTTNKDVCSDLKRSPLHSFELNIRLSFSCDLSY